MWLFPIYALVLYGAPIAILGLVNLYLVPSWRVTFKNLLVFVFGGFVGIFGLANGIKWILEEFARPLRWGIHARRADDVALYIIIAAGAELGGAGLLYLKSRVRRTPKRIRSA